jgi:short-subunit dehydrogenase
MDANPSLYIHDKFFVNDKSLNETFRGKTMWITGASSGIGAELALQLSRHGVNLILSARPSDRLEAVADSCRQQASDCGSSIYVVPFDLSSSQGDLESAVDSVLEIVETGDLDFVVLNAGRGQLMPASLTDHRITQAIFQLNTLAPIALTQILLDRGALAKNRGSHMIVTSSVGAKFGVPLSASYAASKHALHGYYNSLKAECPWLRIDLVCPGPIDTSFHECHIGGSSRNKIEADAIKSDGPTGRGLKMPVSRCTSLLVSSITMGSASEYWLAEQPTLLGLYINQLFPGLLQKTLSKVGPMRVKAWEDGKDLYDPNTWKEFRSTGDSSDK